MCMSNCVYNFYMFLSLSTYDTAYKICLTCLLYTEKVSKFFETGNSAGKHIIYM